MRAHGMIHLVFGLVFCLLAWPALAGDAGEANKLMIEAIKLMDAVDLEPSAEKKFDLLKEAHDKLTEIINRYPSTDLAVKLATGQRIGKVSLDKIRNALEEARVAVPARPGAPVWVWRHGSVVTVAAWSANGRRALTAEVGGTAAVRDISTGKILHTWQHPSELAAADVSSDGRRMLAVGVDRIVTLRSARTGRILDEWGYEGTAGAVALSPDGRRALTGLHYRAHLADIGARKVLHTWRGKAPVTAAAYSPDGRRVFMGFADGRATLGDVDTGVTRYRWKHPGSAGGGVMSAVFSADSRRVLAGAANGTAVLRDVETGKTLRKWDLGYSYRVRAVAYSPDGRWVLTGDDGREIELHDVRTGRTLRKWKYEAAPAAVAFSPRQSERVDGIRQRRSLTVRSRAPQEEAGRPHTDCSHAAGWMLVSECRRGPGRDGLGLHGHGVRPAPPHRLR